MLFIVNSGRKPPNFDPQGSIIITDLLGTILQEIQAPDIPGVGTSVFQPTTVAVMPDRIALTDGYGSNRVFCFDAAWRHLWTIDGNEGAAGPLNNPHWIHWDQRGGKYELYIADRGADRIQVYNTEGVWLRSFGADWIRTPSVFAPLDDQYLLIGELQGRLLIVDEDDALVSVIGDGSHHCAKPGWPNRKGPDDERIAPGFDIPEGEFNSPHGIATDSQGSIYISEWLLGGRYRSFNVFNSAI